jgi:hypothetical protein
MINTNKKIHIYNRFRYIYRSKNRYYIRYNKRYIDLYSIIKKTNVITLQNGGGDKHFLKKELDYIKTTINIYKFIMEEKQKEALNLYVNFVSLLNSQRDIIINKINSYPPNHFDNELNMAAIITFGKNILYYNIFNNYLMDIIPRIDHEGSVTKENIEFIIKGLVNYDEKSIYLQNFTEKINQYNKDIKDLREDYIGEHNVLINSVYESLDSAIDKFKENDEESTNNKQEDIDDIKNINGDIKNDTDIIKDSLNELKDYEWIDILLNIFKNEHNYYKKFIDKDKDNTEIKNYLEDINKFLQYYRDIYEGNIEVNNEDMVLLKAENGKYKNDIDKHDKEKKTKEEELNKIELKNLENGNDDIKIGKNKLSAELKDLRDKIYVNKDLLIKNENKLNIKVSEISQYKDNNVKITILYNLIKDTITEISSFGNPPDDISSNNNISAYKLFINNMILYIKNNILFSFIENYKLFCKKSNEHKKEYLAKCEELVSKNEIKYNKDIKKSGTTSGGGNKKIKNDKNITICAYLTDVEGNLDYFHKYVGISKVITWVDSNKNRLKFKQDNSMFVFGGDTQDRGIGDIRFVNILLKFKDEYPDRVEFIIGNRDANKIRFYSELSEKITNTNKYLSKYDKFPYWVDEKERISIREYLEKNNYEINIVNRLKYILEYTMGSSGSFEKRRVELAILLNKNAKLISDEDIVNSFLNSVSPRPVNVKNSNDNYLLKYLKYGKIAYIFGEHIFIHGAINKNNIGYVPSTQKEPKKHKIIDDVKLWVSGLNNWFHKELNEYILDPENGGITKKRKGYKIIDYSVPSNNRTVVYSDNLKNGNGQYINTKVIKYLNKDGISSIISGHRPHGDCPLVLRSKNLTAVSADISYSDRGHISKWGIDNRGSAVCEVLLYINGDIQVHGILSDKSKYNYIIKNKGSKDTSNSSKYDKYIGIQLKNNYWVKNVKKSKYLISYAKGFELDEKWISIKELQSLL